MPSTVFFRFLVRLVLPRATIDFERILPVTDMILIAASNVVLVRNDILRRRAKLELFQVRPSYLLELL